MRVLWLLLVWVLWGCQSEPSTTPRELASWPGVVVNQPQCDSDQCKAVIKRSEGYWSYDDVYVGTAGLHAGDTVYKTCAYYRTHERCSGFWTLIPDTFYPPTIAE